MQLPAFKNPHPATQLPGCLVEGLVGSFYRIQGRVLYSGVTLQVEAGRSLVITGPSGCGKTSLLRAICGLWPACRAANVTLVSIAHRPTVIPYHDRIMAFDGAGGWKLCDRIEQEQSRRPSSPNAEKAKLAPDEEGEEGEEAAAWIRTGAPDGRGDAAGSSVEAEAAEQAHSFDLQLVRRVSRLLGVLFPRVLSGTFGAFLLCIGMSLAAAEVQVKMQRIQARIAVQLTGDCEEALAHILEGAALLVIKTTLLTVSGWIGQLLGLTWRRRITARLHSEYFHGDAVYHINKVDPLDGVDQRLVQDLQKMTELGAEIFFGTASELSLPVLLVQPAGAAGPDELSVPVLLVQAFLFTHAAASAGWFAPMILYGYTIFSLGVLAALMASVAKARLPHLPWVTTAMQAAEASFRFALARVREHCESIVFFGGEHTEKSIVERRFKELFEAMHRWARALWPVVFVQLSSIELVNNVVIYIIFAAQTYYWAPRVQDDSWKTECLFVLNSLSVLGYVLSAVPFLFAKLGVFAGLVHRVADLQEAFAKRIRAAEADKGENHIAKWSITSNRIALEEVTVSLPFTHRVLYSGVTLQVEAGRSLVITGPSGCGKTSLLRAICGLWPAPYLMQRTSLRAQLLYPLACPPHADLMEDWMRAALEEVLETVGLGKLAACLDKEDSWEETLSGGEQQRLAFARVLHHRPLFAVLDEATSAMDMWTEARCLQACKDAGITMVSIAHRPSAVAFHECRLHFTQQGNWEMSDIDVDDVDLETE
eukprot:gene3779-4727_t